MSLPQDFFGNQSTALRWNSLNNQLHFKISQIVSSFRDLSVKYKGDVNTVTGEHRHTFHIGRAFATNDPFFADFLPLVRFYERKITSKHQRSGAGIRNDEDSELLQTADLEENVNKFLPGGLRSLFLEDFALYPGLTISNDADNKFRYTIKFRKLPQYIKHFHRTDSLLELKARADIHPVTKEVSLKASPRLSVFRFNVTPGQNVRATVGCDLATSLEGDLSKELYLSVTDFRWDLKLKQRRWQFTYNL